MAMADRVKSEAREWGGKGISFIEVPQHMRLTSKDRRQDSPGLREPFARTVGARGSVGCLG
jgi:hypothetical protein